jgi:hypothetical protein
MAEAFPASRFVGYDLADDAIGGRVSGAECRETVRCDAYSAFEGAEPLFDRDQVFGL